MTPAELLKLARAALPVGQMSLVLPVGFKRPPGFPRGELLNERGDERTWAFSARKMVAWCEAHRRELRL